MPTAYLELDIDTSLVLFNLLNNWSTKMRDLSYNIFNCVFLILNHYVLLYCYQFLSSFCELLFFLHLYLSGGGENCKIDH